MPRTQIRNVQAKDDDPGGFAYQSELDQVKDNGTGTNFTVATMNNRTLWERIGGSVDKFRMYVPTGRTKNTSNSYLDQNAMPTNTIPIRFPFDVVLETLIASTDGNESWTGELRTGGVLIAGASVTVTNTDYATAEDLDVTINADTAIQFYCNGSGINAPQLTAIFRQKEVTT